MVINPENLQKLQTAIKEGHALGTFAPSIYVVELSNKCNLDCIMCPNSRLDRTVLGDITEETYGLALDQISPYAELTMLYFLGESTLHPNFVNLLKMARKKLSGKIVISTNALNLTTEIINALIEFTDIIIVCIDRWNKHAYEKIRMGSTFDTVVSNAERLLKLRGKDQHNPRILIKALDIAFPGETRSEIDVEAESFRGYWSERGAIPLAGWLDTWAGQLPELEKFATISTPYTNLERVPCADLWFKMVINWNGNVALCCHDWQPSKVLGNIYNADIKSIWQSQDIVRIRKGHLINEFHNCQICFNCREWAMLDELQSYIRLNESDLFQVF